MDTPYTTPRKVYSSSDTHRSRSRRGRYDYVVSPEARSGSWNSGSGSRRRLENTQYLRVPEGSEVKVGPGTIKEVHKAVYRVESTIARGVEKDVTELVRGMVTRGGLNLKVTSSEMGVRHDPYKDEPKVLVITYTPVRGGVVTQLAKPVSERERGTQFIRVPEHGTIDVPKGSIMQLISAEYRLEGDAIGMQKDVTEIVLNHLRYGGLHLRVNNDTMKVATDPHPEKEKVLVVTYIPRPEPELVTLDIREGEWVEIPEGTISILKSADLRLPYHDEAGHGFAVDVYNAVSSMVANGGIKGFIVTKRGLGVDYDPFDEYGKVLRLVYLPKRLGGREIQRCDAGGTVRDAERLLCKPYRPRDARDHTEKGKVMATILRILNEVQRGGGWGAHHLSEAEALLRTLDSEEDITLTRRLITLARSNHVTTPPEMFSLVTSPTPPPLPEWKRSPHHLLASAPEPPLHPSAAYHVGTPLGMRPTPFP